MSHPSKPKNKTQSFLTPSLDKVRNQSVPTQVTKLTLAEPKVIQDKTPKPALNTQKEIKVEKKTYQINKKSSVPYRISAFTGFPTLYNMMLIYDTNKDVKSVTKKIKISAAYGMDEISSAYELGYQYNLFKFVYGRKVWSDLEEFEYNYLGSIGGGTGSGMGTLLLLDAKSDRIHNDDLGNSEDNYIVFGYRCDESMIDRYFTLSFQNTSSSKSI